MTEQPAPTGESIPPLPSSGASELVGDALPTLSRYVGWLADAGVRRGLLGPREVSRLWERHIFNCAAVTELIAPAATLWDLGSGAGLPGVVIAVLRPDVQVTLLEPLLRRTTFLSECVADLGLENVSVVRGRAEEWAGRVRLDVVTARAVAPLDRLAGWALPLLRAEGELLAIKGEHAEAEVRRAQPALARLGARSWEVVRAGSADGALNATVVRVRAGGSTRPDRDSRRPRASRSARRHG